MITEDQQRDLDVLIALVPVAPVYSPPGVKFSAVEDQIITMLAGKKTAENIGVIIGRDQQGVTKRIGALGLSGRLRGENHHRAKLNDLQVRMLHSLHDQGFKVSEIHKCCFSHMSYDGVLAALKKRGAI